MPLLPPPPYLGFGAAGPAWQYIVTFSSRNRCRMEECRLAPGAAAQRSCKWPSSDRVIPGPCSAMAPVWARGTVAPVAVTADGTSSMPLQPRLILLWNSQRSGRWTVCLASCRKFCRSPAVHSRSRCGTGHSESHTLHLLLGLHAITRPARTPENLQMPIFDKYA